MYASETAENQPRPRARRLRSMSVAPRPSSGERGDSSDPGTEKSRRFTEGETEQEVGCLAGGRTGIAQGARQVGAEHVADADAGTDERHAGKPGADLFG